MKQRFIQIVDGCPTSMLGVRVSFGDIERLLDVSKCLAAKLSRMVELALELGSNT